MNEKASIFDDPFINKNAFYKNKKPISIDKLDIRRIVLFKENSSGDKVYFKFFIRYIHEGSAFLISLFIKLSQTNKYVKYFDNNNKYINLLVRDEKLLKNTMNHGIKLKFI